MKLLPHFKIKASSHLSADEILISLTKEIEGRKIMWTSGNHKYFQGSVGKDWFCISKIIHYKNSFLPTINGKLTSNNTGTDITVKVGFNGVIIFFMTLWTTLCFYGGFAIFHDYIVKRDVPETMFLLPISFFIFGWGLAIGGFWFEAKKQKPVLIKLLKQIGSEPEA